MKLNKKSWHYKMWRRTFCTFENIPDDTDLCRYCHRVFWHLVLCTFLAVGFSALFGMLLYTFLYKGLVLHTIPTLIATAAVAAVVGLVYLYYKWLDGNSKNREPKTLVGKWFRATKQGVCPLVEFTDDD